MVRREIFMDYTPTNNKWECLIWPELNTTHLFISFLDKFPKMENYQYQLLLNFNLIYTTNYISWGWATFNYLYFLLYKKERLFFISKISWKYWRLNQYIQRVSHSLRKTSVEIRIASQDPKSTSEEGILSLGTRRYSTFTDLFSMIIVKWESMWGEKHYWVIYSVLSL